jgi:hypothetical protein
MNHGFINMTQKVSANQYTERAPVHQAKESMAEQIQFQSNYA